MQSEYYGLTDCHLLEYFSHIYLTLFLLYRGQCEELEKVLASFFKRIVAGLNEENRGIKHF